MEAEYVRKLDEALKQMTGPMKATMIQLNPEGFRFAFYCPNDGFGGSVYVTDKKKLIAIRANGDEFRCT